MKTKSYRKLIIITSAVMLILAGGVSWQFVNAQTEPQAQADIGSTASLPADAELPPDVATNDALVEIIRLSQAGVSGEVISNYIANCQYRFNLTASQLVYLKDIGMPDGIVMAMIQRDQQLGEAAPMETVQTAPAPATTTVVVDDNYFGDSLAPYGSWVVIEGYGRCWRPSVVVYDAGWRPYCDHGHWIYTDCGWYWASDYSWGATFHYGRWFYNAHYGWCWWPDTVWAPSWVCWRYSDNYCGWAPLPPRCYYREGVGLVYNGAHVSVGFDFGFGVGAFTFVSTSHFCDRQPWHYRVPQTQVTQIYNQTTVVNDITVNNNTTIINHGIPPHHITDVTHQPIHPVAIHDSDRPIARGQEMGRDGDTLFVSRPHFPGNRDGSPGRNNGGGDNHQQPVAQSPGAPAHPAPVQNPPQHNSGAPFAGQPNNPRDNDNHHQPGQQPVGSPVVQPHPQSPVVNNGGNHNGWPSQSPGRNNGNDNNRFQPVAPATSSPNTSPGNNQQSAPAFQRPPQRSYGAPYSPPQNNNPPAANNNNQSGQQSFVSPRMQSTQPQPQAPAVNNGGNHNERPSPPAHNEDSRPAPQHDFGAPVNHESSAPAGHPDFQPPQNNRPSHDSAPANQRGNSDKDKNGH